MISFERDDKVIVDNSINKIGPLLPLEIKQSFVDNLKNKLPELPDKKKERLVPFNDDHIEEIDIKKKVLFLNPSYYEI